MDLLPSLKFMPQIMNESKTGALNQQAITCEDQSMPKTYLKRKNIQQFINIFPNYEDRYQRRSDRSYTISKALNNFFKNNISVSFSPKKQNIYNFINSKQPKIKQQQNPKFKLQSQLDIDEKIGESKNQINLLNNNTKYKAYICKGNNGDLVKQMIKSRSQWIIIKEIKQADFVWTQSLKQLNLLPFNHPNNNNYCIKLHNHIENNNQLGYKKYLYQNLTSSDPTYSNSIIPLTFHINNQQDLDHFLTVFDSQSIYIIKPAEFSNRGNGISLTSDINQIKSICQQSCSEEQKTYIIQQYITNPQLIEGRKFDVRCYALFTSIYGQQKGYWYQEGYIRTSSKKFKLNKLNDKLIHLTNDAIQSKSKKYGKYESANKLPFHKYVTPNLIKQMKQITKIIFESTKNKLDPRKLQNSFELFGLDFLFDKNQKVWLLEVNTNPCLQTNCALLYNLKKKLLENIGKLVIDPLYLAKNQNLHEDQAINQFELIFFNNIKL